MVDDNKERLSDEQTGFFHEVIDLLPLPVAIFDRNLIVTSVNKTFRDMANKSHSLSEIIRIQRDRIDDPQLAASFMNVFKGDTLFSESVKSPFSMFSGVAHEEVLLPGYTYRIEVSPFYRGDEKITHGMILIMQKKMDR